MASWTEIILEYVCPSIGCILSSIMFAAPVYDLRQALKRGSMGTLDPYPWVAMTGNCLGWCGYAYYTRDPFILASNLPGLVLSIWLNTGAAKLQYMAILDNIRKDGPSRQASTSITGSNENRQQSIDESNNSRINDGDDDERDDKDDRYGVVTVPQERMLLRMLVGWSVVLVYVGWLSPPVSPSSIVGVVVNVNLIYFYGAPLNTMRQAIREKHSNAIHRPTLYMNWCNTSFWILYGFARRDPVIFLPNGTGLFLGILQGILCCFYPKVSIVSRQQHDEEPEQGLLDESRQEEEAHANNLVV